VKLITLTPLIPFNSSLIPQKEARKDGLIKSGHDADHGLDLQFGGTPGKENIISTEQRVNRSVGGQGAARKQYPDGTQIRKFVEDK
jgi:hypothetical protein